VAAETRAAPQHSNAYDIFILVLTVLSLVIMVLLLLPLGDATITALTVYDNLICGIFLVDFGLNLTRARSKREFFIAGGGWLDLLGSIPSLGILRFTALFRLARLGRVARILRLMRAKDRGSIMRDVIENRSQYALFITFLAALIVLSASTVLMLQFEARSPDANITTGGDALWWGFVTITTVGYGDTFPVTTLGRLTAVFVMFAGVGIIGSLASILASVLVPQGDDGKDDAGDARSGLEAELAQIRSELAAMRELMAGRSD
jgi:voltage-gated potassium channel